MTILLDTKITINKNAAWLNDEALRSGVFFSLSRLVPNYQVLMERLVTFSVENITPTPWP